MKRQDRDELERRVLELERQRPKASAREFERELELQAPVAYGNWREETPEARSRLRAIQRWRSGQRGADPGKSPRHLFPYVWPVGDRQRREVDSSHQVSPLVAAGSWRVFLYNCGPEVVRDVRVLLDERELDYSPSILTGKFSEIHWQRLTGIRSLLGDGQETPETPHHLRVDFVVNRGLRQAHIEGELTLHASQGWVRFEGRDGRGREIE